MNHYPAPPLDATLKGRLRAIANSGATHVELIAEMRSAGLSIIPSIRLLSEFTGLSVSEAKEAVHFSETWADCLQANNATHEAAFEAAKQLGFAEVDLTQDSPRPVELQEAR